MLYPRWMWKKSYQFLSFTTWELSLFYHLNFEGHVQLMISSDSSYTYVNSHPLVSVGFWLHIPALSIGWQNFKPYFVAFLWLRQCSLGRQVAGNVCRQIEFLCKRDMCNSQIKLSNLGQHSGDYFANVFYFCTSDQENVMYPGTQKLLEFSLKIISH